MYTYLYYDLNVPITMDEDAIWELTSDDVVLDGAKFTPIEYLGDWDTTEAEEREFDPEADVYNGEEGKS